MAALPAWSLTVVVGLAVCWLLRARVLEAYPVPTPSMEPTIEGDEQRGDVVVVEKVSGQRLSRYDMVVFHHEEEGEQEKIVVKRVVALPGETVQLREYDLWVGPTRDELTRVAKLPGRDQDLLATYWDSTRSKGGWSGERWRSDRTTASAEGLAMSGAGTTHADLFPTGERTRAAPAWNLVLEGRITTGYLNGFDDMIEGAAWAIDFGVDVLARATPGSTIWIALRYGNLSLALSYSASGEAALWRDGRPLSAAVGSVIAPPLSDQRRLQYMYLDGRLCLAVDGHDVLQCAVEQSDLREAARDQLARANGLALAASGGEVTLRSGRVVHDFHYLRLGRHASDEPYAVPADHYFVLGDNSQESKDSRHYHDGAIAADQILGRPLLIAAPWARRRWLRR